MTRVHVETASDRLAEVEHLLVAVGLPTAGLRDQFPAAYVVALDGPVLLGCAGLETYRTVGLLRSVAVSPSGRGRGIGRALVADRIDEARKRGLETVYLLTTTAAAFFAYLGFAPTDRAAVPSALAASPEFAGACPASATCMSQSLR